MIFINTRYAAKSVQDLLLLHEAGHVLGLAGWGTNTANYHCLDDNSLMHRKQMRERLLLYQRSQPFRIGI